MAGMKFIIGYGCLVYGFFVFCHKKPIYKAFFNFIYFSKKL